MLTRCENCNRVYDGDLFQTCPFEDDSSVMRCASCGRIFDSRTTEQCPNCPPPIAAPDGVQIDFTVCAAGHTYRRDLYDACPVCAVPKAETPQAIGPSRWPVWLAAMFAISALPFGLGCMWLFSKMGWRWAGSKTELAGSVAALFVIAATSLGARAWRGSKILSTERGLYWLGVALVASTLGVTFGDVMGLGWNSPNVLVLGVGLIGIWLVLASVATKLVRSSLSGIEAGFYWLGASVAAVVAIIIVFDKTNWTFNDLSEKDASFASACALVLLATAAVAWSRRARVTRGEMVVYWICSICALLLGSVLYTYPGLTTWEHSRNRLIVGGIIALIIILFVLSWRQRRTWPLAIPAAAYAMVFAFNVGSLPGRQAPSGEKVGGQKQTSAPVAAFDGQNAAAADFEVRPASNLFGAILRKLVTSNVTDCVTQCRQSSECSGFVYYEAVKPGPYIPGRMQLRSPAQCALHSGVVEPVPDARGTAYILKQGARQTEPRLAVLPELASRPTKEASMTGGNATSSACNALFVGAWANNQGACKNSNFSFGRGDVKIIFTSSAAQYFTPGNSYGCAYAQIGLAGKSCSFSATCSSGYGNVKRGDIGLQLGEGRLTGIGPDSQRFVLQKCN